VIYARVRAAVEKEGTYYAHFAGAVLEDGKVELRVRRAVGSLDRCR